MTVLILALVAHAGEPVGSDVSVTNVGVQSWSAPALKAVVAADDDPTNDSTSDLDILFGQRLRWTLSDNGSTRVVARMNGQFTISPGEAESPLWKRNRVRKLGVSIVGEKVTVDIGRSGVYKGGPRLVDGLQVIGHTSSTVDVGAWAGLQPDLYTTDPRVRPGGGPILAYKASRVQASAVGEFVLGGGGADRAGVLLQGRASAARTFDVSARADLDFLAGKVSDVQLFMRWSPTETVAIDGFYNLFSSYVYQRTQDLDPDLQRFAQRIVSVGNEDLLPSLLQNCLDPGVNHMVGGDFRMRPQGTDTGLYARLGARYRFGSNAELLPEAGEATDLCILADNNAFLRVSPSIGVANLPVGGGIDLTVDANLYNIEGRQQADAGVSLYFEPTDEGLFAFDTSYRMLFNKYDPVTNPYGYAGQGHYADLFVDVVVVPADLMIGAGVNFESEPAYLADDATPFSEGAYGAFLRLSKYIRPGRD